MRVTRKLLETKVGIVNRLLGYDPDPAYSTIGALHLYGAYGGYDVHRWVNDAGGVESINGYCTTARELDRVLTGMIAALRIVGER